MEATQQQSVAPAVQTWHTHAHVFVNTQGDGVSAGGTMFDHLERHLALTAARWVLDNGMMLRGTIWEQFRALPGMSQLEFEQLAFRYLLSHDRLPQFAVDYPGVAVSTEMSPYRIEVQVRRDGLLNEFAHSFTSLPVEGKSLGEQLKLLRDYWFTVRTWVETTLKDADVPAFGGNLSEAESKLLQDVTNRISDQVSDAERAVLLKFPKLLVDALSRVEF